MRVKIGSRTSWLVLIMLIGTVLVQPSLHSRIWDEKKAVDEDCGPDQLSGPAQGEGSDLLEMSLEDLMKIEIDTVYGASKYEQKINKAPASITLITTDEMRKCGYRTLADIRAGVRGFYLTYDREYHY